MPLLVESCGCEVDLRVDDPVRIARCRWFDSSVPEAPLVRGRGMWSCLAQDVDVTNALGCWPVT